MDADTEAWLEGVRERKGGQELDTVSKDPSVKESAVMGRTCQ